MNRLAGADGAPDFPAGNLLVRIRLPLDRWDLVVYRKVGIRDYPIQEHGLLRPRDAGRKRHSRRIPPRLCRRSGLAPARNRGNHSGATPSPRGQAGIIPRFFISRSFRRPAGAPKATVRHPRRWSSRSSREVKHGSKARHPLPYTECSLWRRRPPGSDAARCPSSRVSPLSAILS